MAPSVCHVLLIFSVISLSSEINDDYLQPTQSTRQRQNNSSRRQDNGNVKRQMLVARDFYQSATSDANSLTGTFKFEKVAKYGRKLGWNVSGCYCPSYRPVCDCSTSGSRVQLFVSNNNPNDRRKRRQQRKLIRQRARLALLRAQLAALRAVNVATANNLGLNLTLNARSNETTAGCLCDITGCRGSNCTNLNGCVCVNGTCWGRNCQAMRDDNDSDDGNNNTDGEDGTGDDDDDDDDEGGDDGANGETVAGSSRRASKARFETCHCNSRGCVGSRCRHLNGCVCMAGRCWGRQCNSVDNYYSSKGTRKFYDEKTADTMNFGLKLRRGRRKRKRRKKKVHLPLFMNEPEVILEPEFDTDIPDDDIMDVIKGLPLSRVVGLPVSRVSGMPVDSVRGRPFSGVTSGAEVSTIESKPIDKIMRKKNWATHNSASPYEAVVQSQSIGDETQAASGQSDRIRLRRKFQDKYKQFYRDKLNQKATLAPMIQQRPNGVTRIIINENGQNFHGQSSTGGDNSFVIEKTPYRTVRIRLPSTIGTDQRLIGTRPVPLDSDQKPVKMIISAQPVGQLNR